MYADRAEVDSILVTLHQQGDGNGTPSQAQVLRRKSSASVDTTLPQVLLHAVTAAPTCPTKPHRFVICSRTENNADAIREVYATAGA